LHALRVGVLNFISKELNSIVILRSRLRTVLAIRVGERKAEEHFAWNRVLSIDEKTSIPSYES